MLLTVKRMREVLHELFILQKLKNVDVREIVEFEEKEIIIATFEYENKNIKIVAKIRENGRTIFEKIIEQKTKFDQTFQLATDIMRKIGSELL